jgi:hypothetical protein
MDRIYTVAFKHFCSFTIILPYLIYSINIRSLCLTKHHAIICGGVL